jgi:hypothetical protein
MIFLDIDNFLSLYMYFYFLFVDFFISYLFPSFDDDSYSMMTGKSFYFYFSDLEFR